MQTRSYDCGLACIRTVLSLKGIRVTEPLLERKCKLTPAGMTQQAMIMALRSFGITASLRYQLTARDIFKLRVKGRELIVYEYDEDHWSVLRCITPNKVSVHDPYTGAWDFTHKEYFNNYGTFGLVCGRKPVQQFTEEKCLSLDTPDWAK